MIYALEVVLLTLLIWIVSAPAGTSDFAGRAAPASSICSSSSICWRVLTGDPDLGALQIWLMGFAVADVPAGR